MPLMAPTAPVSRSPANKETSLVPSFAAGPEVASREPEANGGEKMPKYEKAPGWFTSASWVPRAPHDNPARAIFEGSVEMLNCAAVNGMTLVVRSLQKSEAPG